MEDSIEVIMQEYGTILPLSRPHPVLSACTGALLTGLYGVWSLFTMPGFRKIPSNLKVPYLPSSKEQTLNIMKLLEGRTGRLADLGSGDGRLVFAASSAGFKCTGFEINSVLVTYARSKASWNAVPSSQAVFVKKDFWRIDLSQYDNVTAFLAPGAIFEEKNATLMAELRFCGRPTPPRQTRFTTLRRRLTYCTSPQFSDFASRQRLETWRKWTVVGPLRLLFPVQREIAAIFKRCCATRKSGPSRQEYHHRGPQERQPLQCLVKTL
ncbi:adenine nucleotide translocase lysine N-methyltransferase isoform X1 [Corythoichthys intestinalis]|uniref:adenine nucleotide translocase lysine N-methyltransferase isoform X1 n=1 Tax=Corythoichthys intestinalis TaxID=161448 RepID=UPI0025A55D14|nr:adenine nucleotide translocase lysine N-methyltransferase isoform X1 [Corythoichthys intestinalis]